jgi:glycosyltransferase involved in cell wall biosynthesis
MTMKVLFIHQNFPGQYKHLAPRLAALGHRVKALCVNQMQGAMPGVDVIRYPIARGSSPNIHPLVSEFETKVIRGEACSRAMRKLKEQGFTPDIILAHPGWGEAMFAKEVFPEAKLLSFIEYYYAAEGQDVNFDKEFGKRKFEDDMRTLTKNANSLMALNAMDWGVSPTAWQRDTNPPLYRDRISVIHDGIDTDRLRPNPQASFTVPDGGPTFTVGDELVTFVNRNLEPLRGFHIFMRSLPAVLAARPNARVVIVGSDGKGYGGGAGGWKDRMLRELGDRVDASRLHFVGRVAYPDFISLLQVSMAHVYLSYPFVLSWSLLEAMSLGCLVIGSGTAPIREVVTDGETGLLADFFDIDGLSQRMIEALETPLAQAPIREAARRHVVSTYDLQSVCLPAHLALIDKVLEGGISAD